MAKLWNDEDTFVITEAGELLHKASEAIKRVRELHQPDKDYPEQCTACCVPEDTGEFGACGIAIPSPYPCATIQALDGETV